jgi:hypothetical protein
MVIYAAKAWPSNAELIADVVELGYIKPSDLVLDPTAGREIWWKQYRPKRLIARDINRDGFDFRKMPYRDGMFDVVAFDPPYVAPGGRKTSTWDDFNDRFGTHTTPRTPLELQDYIHDGFKECVRVVKPGGIILWKCCDYVWSGKIWLGTHHSLTYALALGCQMQDRFEFVGRVRAQPKRTRADGTPSRQQHARRNISTLFVLKTPK